MGPEVAFEVRLTGAARSVFLGRLAQVIAFASPGVAVLLEVRLGDGEQLTVIARPPGLVAGIRSMAAEFPGGIRDGFPGPPPAPGPRGWEERWGRLVRAFGRTGPPQPEGHPPRRPLPRFRPPFGADLRLAVQSHWISRGDGHLEAPTRYRLAAPPGRAEAACLRATALLRSVLGPTIAVRWHRPTRGAQRRWEDGRLGLRHRLAAVELPWEEAPRTVEPPASGPFPDATDLSRHLVVLGASGSGKTTFLVRLAAARIRRGEPVVLFDLHGDLGPAIAARLPAPARARLVVLDPTVGPGNGPGIPILGAEEEGDRAAAHVVAALKRLSADGSDVYWGFRLERVFGTLVRAVQEEGGTLLDVYDLLTDANRRDATRLATKDPAVERFLGELPSILKRAPDYLVPAAARLAHVALSPRLAALLAPGAETGVPVGPLLAGGRSLLLRLPLGELGPEASGFAATLLLTRVYLELARRPPDRSVLLVLDEAQAFSPRLLAEVLAEGRKFRVEAVLATQFPDRLAPELRAAAAGAVGAHLVFRLPAPAARGAAAWAGLTIPEAEAILPTLSDGVAVAAGGATTPVPRLLYELPLGPPAAPEAWASLVQATRAEWGTERASGHLALDAPDERLLLALYAARAPLSRAELARTVAGEGGAPEGSALERLGSLERRRLVLVEDGRLSLTTAGARLLGASAEHGSSVEGTEHRQLLLEAFAIFARHGERLTLLRQGRFDTRLPDGRLELLPSAAARLPPEELHGWLEARRRAWAWRAFGGRNVHVEAEVSGADRPERVRRDYVKAARARAHPLFLVPDARRARRIRETLHRFGVAPRAFTVWTLPQARQRHGLDLPGPG